MLFPCFLVVLINTSLFFICFLLYMGDQITSFRQVWTYAEEVNLVTALVPSETACLASSPGNKSLTAVWISREERVAFLLYLARREASRARRSKMSLMKEFRMDIPLLEIPVLG